MRLGTRPPLERFALIDREIREGAYPNSSDLSRIVEVTTRTIQRDLRFMRDRLNAPIEFDAIRNGYHYADPDFRLPFFKITEGELLSLFLAERLLQAYGDAPFAADLARFFDKVKTFLPTEISFDLRHLFETTTVRRSSTIVSDARRLHELYQAMHEGRQLELEYWSASRDETCRRVVDPYHLTSIDGDWYLIAYCHLREEVRMFAPARIRELHPTGEGFERPADFRLADYLDVGFRKMRGAGTSWTIRLRFLPTIARYVRERTWHPTQEIEEQADGSLILSIKVNHLVEVRRWVLSFGSECEVLEPDELKEQIFEEIRKMLDRSQRTLDKAPASERHSHD